MSKQMLVGSECLAESCTPRGRDALRWRLLDRTHNLAMETTMRPFSLIYLVLVIIPLWRICTRAGFHGALSLLTLIPLVGPFIVGAILSFANWPAKRSGS